MGVAQANNRSTRFVLNRRKRLKIVSVLIAFSGSDSQRLFTFLSSQENGSGKIDVIYAYLELKV